MFCTKCGTQNVLETDNCIACGAPLIKPNNINENIQQTANQFNQGTIVPNGGNISQNIEPERTNNFSQPVAPPPINNQIPKGTGAIRKTIKAESKKHIKGYHIGLAAIYLGISIILGILMTNIFGVTTNNGIELPIWASLVQEIIIFFFAAIFNYALISSYLDIIRGKQANFNTAINKPFKNIKNLLIIFGVSTITYGIGFIAGFISGMIPILGIFILIALFIAVIYFTPVCQILICLYSDDNYQKQNITSSIKRAMAIAKGNRVEYYGMMCSFIGWALLSILTLGILFIWLLPYMQIALANMYRKWIGEATYNQQGSGLSNGAVVGLSAGGGCGCFIIFIIIIASLTSFLLYELGYTNFDELIEDYSANGEIDIQENYDFDDTKDNESNSSNSSNSINNSGNEVTIGRDNNYVTFIVPNGFNNAYDGNSEIFSSFYNKNFDNIKYSNTYAEAALAYENEKKATINYRNQNYQYEDTEFTKTINGQNVKVFLTKETTTYGSIYYDAFAIYPVNNKNSILIDIQINEESGTLNQNNITDYIKVK